MIPITIILHTKDENLMYKGYLSEHDNDKTIQYLDENMDTVKVFIGTGQVVIDRKNSIMDFNAIADSEFEYRTEFGSLVFRLATKAWKIEGQRCDIEYSLYDEYDNLAFTNQLSMEYIKE